MSDEPVGDKQLWLAAEAIVVHKYGISAVYRDLQRVRDDALATQAARIDELERKLADSQFESETRNKTIEAMEEDIEEILAESAALRDRAATADPNYLGSTTWKGWTVDLYDGDDDDE